MPIEGRATLRLALGLAVAALIGWGRGGPFAYLLPLLVVTLLGSGAPAPAPGQALTLLVLTGLACLWGLLLAPLLLHAPLLGVLLMLAVVGLAALLTGLRPALTVPLQIFILGDTLVACIAYQSQAVALAVGGALLLAMALALLIMWAVALLLPDTAPPLPMPAPLPLPADRAGWIGLRAALVMALPVVLALNDPGLFIMTLMKGAQLARQDTAGQARSEGRAVITSTAAGGALALLCWQVLGLWPGLLLLTGLLVVLALLAGPRLFAASASADARAWWQGVLVTTVLVLGTAVGDSPTGSDIGLLMLRRVVMMLALTVFATLVVAGLDRLQGWRRGASLTKFQGGEDAVQ